VYRVLVIRASEGQCKTVLFQPEKRLRGRTGRPSKDSGVSQ
jgi:hypothetical protein